MNDCIQATGALMPNGYGRATHEGRQQLAHRVAWQKAHGPIPLGMEVMHTCDNPPCINISHLKLGTHAENMADMKAKGRTWRQSEKLTHCKQGHEFTPENTRWTERSDGLRVRTCRTCRLRTGRSLYVPHPRPAVTHCPKGHPYDESNTYTNTKGRKVCRACKRKRDEHDRDRRRTILGSPDGS